MLDNLHSRHVVVVVNLFFLRVQTPLRLVNLALQHFMLRFDGVDMLGGARRVRSASRGAVPGAVPAVTRGLYDHRGGGSINIMGTLRYPYAVVHRSEVHCEDSVRTTDIILSIKY